MDSASHERDESHSKQDVRICFVGDSFVHGTSDPTCLGWTGRLCARAIAGGVSLTHYNLGIRGNTSVDVAERWERECALRFPEHVDKRVVFSFGTNDVNIIEGRQRVSKQTSMTVTRTILAKAKERFPTLMIGPGAVEEADYNARIQDLCAVLEQTAASVSVPYLPVHGVLANSSTWMNELRSGEGSHPEGAGYSVLCDLVEAWDAW